MFDLRLTNRASHALPRREEASRGERESTNGKRRVRQRGSTGGGEEGERGSDKATTTPRGKSIDSVLCCRARREDAHAVKPASERG